MTLLKPTLVIVDFTEKGKVERNRKPEFDSPEDLIRYLARLRPEDLRDRREGAAKVFDYVTDDRAIVMEFRNFHSKSHTAMAEELYQDIAMAKSPSPVRHGAMSLSISAADDPAAVVRLMSAGHDLMNLLGVHNNRYVLVVHTDTEHVHLHFLYSRVGIGGTIRERKEPFPRYQLEDACAVLAYRHGFALEDGHNSIADEGGVIDIATRGRTRDADFNAVIPACKARNDERRKRTSGHPLERLALDALENCGGSFDDFQLRLARQGVSYEPCGSGCVFVDKRGRRHKASKVNYQLSRGRMLKRFGLTDFPDPSDLAQGRLARARSELTSVDPISAANQIARFLHRRDAAASSTDARFQPELKKWEQDTCRAFANEKRGRPAKGPRPSHWPPDLKFEGAFSGGAAQSPGRHFDEPFSVREQRWQTEIWNDSALIATIAYSRMAIHSKAQSDVRAALLAAHKAWGHVEVFGDRKFRRQIVELAAELNIPLSNPELQKALEAARRRQSPNTSQVVDATAERGETLDRDANAAVPLGAKGNDPGLPAANLASHSDHNANLAPRPHSLANMAPNEPGPAKSASTTSTATQSSGEGRSPSRERRLTRTPPILPAEAIAEFALHQKWPLTKKAISGKTIIVTERRLLAALNLSEDALHDEAVQTLLRPLQLQQEEDYRCLLDAASRGVLILVPRDQSARPGDRELFATNDAAIQRLWLGYQAHPALHDRILRAISERQAAQAISVEAKLNADKSDAKHVDPELDLDAADERPVQPPAKTTVVLLTAEERKALLRPRSFPYEDFEPPRVEPGTPSIQPMASKAAQKDIVEEGDGSRDKSHRTASRPLRQSPALDAWIAAQQDKGRWG